MQTTLSQRLFSLCLSTVLTVISLGSIDHLAKPQTADAGWAAVPHASSTLPRG